MLNDGPDWKVSKARLLGDAREFQSDLRLQVHALCALERLQRRRRQQPGAGQPLVLLAQRHVDCPDLYLRVLLESQLHRVPQRQPQYGTRLAGERRRQTPTEVRRRSAKPLSRRGDLLHDAG